MKQYGNKLTALLLAVSLILPLAACGKNGNTQQLSGMVYVPTYVDIQIPDVEYINQGCVSGENLFFHADVRGEEKTETWVDPQTNESETYTYYDTRTAIFRVPLAGGAAQELDSYVLPELSDNTEGYVYLQNIESGENNTLWVTETMSFFSYEFPEGFDPEANPDEKWQYQTDYKDTIIRRQLDENGAELDRIDLTDLQEKAGVEYLYSTAFDPAGNVYLTSESKVIVMDKTLNKLFELDLDSDFWGELVLLGDGNMGLRGQYRTEDSYGYWMNVIDLQNQAWGSSYELSQNAYSAIPGGGDYLFYYQNNDSLYGWKAGAAESEKIFSWTNSGISRNDMSFFSILNDGRVVVMSQEWGENGKCEGELSILTPTDPKTLPEKTTLTMAAMWVSYDIRNKVLEFNKNSDTCRIEIVDYSEYNTGTDENAGITKLNTEIVAGTVPDLLYTNNLPVNRYAAKGILEDLWPYIEADPEIGGREALMEHVLDVASIDGKLYQAFSSFGIQSVVGPKAVVGDRMSWNLSDLQEALSAMPDGCILFGEYDTKDGMLNRVLSMNLDQFVDWKTGKCFFDSDNFKALLEFCNSFPAEYNWEEHQDEEYEGSYSRVINGKQMLLDTYISDFTMIQFYDKLMNGCSFIGYPKEDGSVGSCFNLPNTCYAISAACKDKEAAWSFVREAFLPRASGDIQDRSGRYYFGVFPINKSDFEKYCEGQMMETYLLDEDGQPVLDENGQKVLEVYDSWHVSDDLRIEIYAATQEDVDRTMALYEAVDSIGGYDNSIYSIIEDVTGAYFAGDRDVDYTASQIQNRVQLYMGENM